MSDVNWALAVPQGPSVADSYLKGFQVGQEMGKTRAVRNALGKAITDPTGAQADLLSAGALPEASALASMQYQQQQRALLGAAYAKLGIGAGVNAITGQPAANAAPAPDPDATAAPGNVEHPSDGTAPANIPHPTDLNPAQAQHALDMSHTFDALGLELSGLPYAQRAARLAEERPALLARGVPAQALDGFDPTDDNIARIHGEMAQLRGMLPPTAATAGADQASPQSPSPSGQPPQAAASTAGAAPQEQPGPGFDIRDPNTQAGLQALAIADPQAAGPLITLGSAVMPKADAARAGTFARDQYGHIAGPRTPDGKIMGTPNNDGTIPVYDPATNTFSIMTAPGATQSTTDIAKAKAAGEAAGREPMAVRQAQAEQDIKDRSTLIEIPMTDGSTVKGTVYDYKNGLGPFAGMGAAAGSPATAGASSTATGATLTEPVDVTKTVGTILGGRTAVADMGDLAARVAGNPDAAAGLRQAVIDHITNRFIGNTEAGTSGQGSLKADAFQTFLRQNRTALGKVLSPSDLETLDGIAADVMRSRRSQDAVKLPGSNTTQDTISAGRTGPAKDHGQSILGWLGMALGGTAGGAHGGIEGGGMGAVAGKAIGDAVSARVQAFRMKGVNRVQDLYDAAFADPEVARRLLARVPTDGAGEIAPRALQARLNSVLMLIGVDATGQQGARQDRPPNAMAPTARQPLNVPVAPNAMGARP